MMFRDFICRLFKHKDAIMTLPGYQGGEVQRLCQRCGAMWLQSTPSLKDMTEEEQKTFCCFPACICVPGKMCRCVIGTQSV